MATPDLNQPTPDTAAPRQPRLGGALPFAALLVISFSVALAIDVGYGGAVGMTLHSSIGFLLCALAILRFVDMRRFTGGFALFDPLARRWRPFAYVWPFIELALGEAYFTFLLPPTVYTISVLLALYLIAGGVLAGRRIDRNDPRLRTLLGLPLPALMLAEAVVMLLMGALLLWL